MTTRIWRILSTTVIVALAGLGAASSSSADRASPEGSAGNASARALLATLVRDGAPGAVALVRDGNHVRSYAAGFADLKRHRPMQAALRFRIGSVSKPMVATLVLKLVAQRRLRLSDTIARWLPGLVPGGTKITVRELLDMRSGLYNYTNSPELIPPYLSGERPLDYVWTPHRLLRLATQHPLDFAPGRRFEYSNTNYIVLGLIVERVTHTRLARYAQLALFGPLGMRSTSFAFGLVPGAHAHGYVPFGPPFAPAGNGLGDVESLNGSNAWAAGGVVSTAGDLDRFFHALFMGRILPPTLLRQMQKALLAEPGPFLHRYGLGLEEKRYPCGETWGHDGDIPGYITVVRASRNAHRLVVLLINRDIPPASLNTALNAGVPHLYCNS